MSAATGVRFALESSVLWTKLDFLEGLRSQVESVDPTIQKVSPLKIPYRLHEPEDHDYSGHDDSDSDSESVQPRGHRAHTGVSMKRNMENAHMTLVLFFGRL